MIGKDHLYAISATRFFGWHAFEVQSNLANFLPLTSNFVIGIFFTCRLLGVIEVDEQNQISQNKI